MARRNGGDTVEAGYYWNMQDWHMHVVTDDGGVLEGGAEARYLRVPTLAMLGAAPLMGLAFVVFLPLMGFVLVFRHFGGKAIEAGRGAAEATAHAMLPMWRAGEVHFTGGRKKAEKKDKGDKGNTPPAAA